MAQVVVESKGGGVHLTRRLTLGCELSCTTINGEVFRGNLMAEDEEAQLVVIQEKPSETSPVVNDNQNVHIINLKNTTKLEIINKPSTPPTSYTHLPQLNTDRIRRRLDANIDAKWKEIRSRGVNVSEKAQNLFDSISKLYNDMEWEKDVIVVLKDVRISPPYTPEDCTGSQPACDRIKKQVAKFHKEAGML